MDPELIGYMEKWLAENNISDVEVIVADFAGVGRGKTIPIELFLGDMRNQGLRIPDSIFSMAVNGDFVPNSVLDKMEQDLYLIPVKDSLVKVPWLEHYETASVICDALYPDGEPANFVPRQVLKNVVNLFLERGWSPYTANEYEFFLMDDPKTLGADPKAPRGDSGFRATGAESYSLDGIGEHAAFFSELYETCELQKIETDTLVHEAGLGQFELNTRHTDPMSGADQAFYFKRALRQVAKRHGMVASFMAKPYPADYGNSMHIHQSLVNSRTGENLFADANDEDTPLFRSYIAGLQKYLPGVMPLLAPYPNSYLRIGTSLMSAPANTHWGYENRSVGLRVPFGGRESRRVENRVPGSDVNPYLALAATLACGYLGIEEKLTPSKPLEGSAYDRKTRLLPRHFFAGLDAFERCTPIRRILGKEFVSLFLDIKNHEYKDEYQELSLWEKTFLLNQV